MERRCPKVAVGDRPAGAMLSNEKMEVVPLDESADHRGFSFSLLSEHLGRIGGVHDLHIAEIRPGEIRGNHYHAKRGEIIAIVYHDEWSLHWDEGDGTESRSQVFQGAGAVAVVPPKNWSHAVRNDGSQSMLIVAASDKPYSRHAVNEIERDAIRRVVTSP
ncbi:polysaccharide biosynthesis C-terminal domain-containing protein [Pseudonocardia eucalypti]